LREHARSSVRARNLVSVYYDTQDHLLSRKRMALRVRQNGRKFIQTLKTASNAEGAETARGEWEVELPNAAPHLDAFDDPAAAELVGDLSPDALTPIYETRFRRQALMIEWPGSDRLAAQIEIAFDRGTIRADGREAPIAEIELELKGGDPRALFELAEAMRGLAPLRLQPLDKAVRGFALATGRPPAWSKARPVALEGSMLVDDALHQVLGACIRHWLDNETAALDGSEPEGLHQLRVALRRLRSAMTLFKGALGEEARRRWNDELRWLLGPLGPARDLDVFAAEIMAPVRKAQPDDPALAELALLVEERRRTAQAGVRETLASERYGDLALGLACWVARRGWRQGVDVDVLLVQRQPILDFATRVLKKRHKQVLKRGRRFAELDAAERHELRIAFKKLRYGAEFFASLYPGKTVERFRKAAARMQGVLGHLNDVAVARKLVHDLLDGLEPGLRQRLAALGAGQVIGWCVHQEPELLPRAEAAWEAFRDTAPFWKGKG
jgi:inorganic triphosphatase YgiF